MLTLNLVAYDRMDLCNPVSPAAVNRVLDSADLKPGDRVAELGCGNAALACLLARRGLLVTAIDRGEAMTALARRHVAAEGLDDQVTVLAGEASDLAGEGAPWRLITVMGATALGDFARLSDWLEPGGWLLWGDLFWTTEPPPVLRKAMNNPDYDFHQGWLDRGAAAGLDVREVRVSTDGDWDAYIAAMKIAVAAWEADNPGHPDAPAIRRHLDGMGTLYGPIGRHYIGFGLYLFRQPD